MNTLFRSESCRSEECTEFYTWLAAQQGSFILFGQGVGHGWAAHGRGDPDVHQSKHVLRRMICC